MEEWIDDTSDNSVSPGNDWRKLLEFNDRGNNWSAPENNCGGMLSQIINWGGPITIIRWDNIDDRDIKDLSIREISLPV